jgi:hypothetical protein
VTLCEFLHVQKLMFESFASHVIDSLGIAHVLIKKRPCVKIRETVPYVKNLYRIKDMIISNHCVRSVSRTEKLVIYIFCNR